MRWMMALGMALLAGVAAAQDTPAFILQPEVQRVIAGLVEILPAQALLGAQACGQGFAETVVEQARWHAGQDLDLLGLLEEEDGAGATQRVVGDVDLRIAAGRGLHLMQQVSGAPALPTAGGEVHLYGRTLRFSA